jgi:mannan endo-1,6-alpha-mannosidase
MWMAYTAILVPQTRDSILPKLQGSAEAIGRQCDGDGSENLCGLRWYQDTFDGIRGLEVQMAALGGITSNLMLMTGTTTLTIDTNPNAEEHHLETSSDEDVGPDALPIIKIGDRVGAWILTGGWSLGIAAAAWWLIKQD